MNEAKRRRGTLEDVLFRPGEMKAQDVVDLSRLEDELVFPGNSPTEFLTHEQAALLSAGAPYSVDERGILKQIFVVADHEHREVAVSEREDWAELIATALNKLSFDCEEKSCERK